MQPSRDRPLIVFDGDDTLWWSEELYDAARKRARDVVEHAGLDGATWERLERDLDVQNVATMGLTAKRFPTSCRDAYRRLALSTRGEVNESVSRAVYEAACSVFSAIARPVPAARAVLDGLHSVAILALVTKGDETVQRKRIEDSGLRRYFSQIVIVDEKTPATFQAMLDAFSAEPSTSWSIGNSVRSDIIPAIEAGMHAVWIDAHVWEHERRHGRFVHSRCHEVKELSDVPSLIMRAKPGRRLVEAAD